MYYGPDAFYIHEVSILEVDGQFENLEEVIYIEKPFKTTM